MNKKERVHSFMFSSPYPQLLLAVAGLLFFVLRGSTPWGWPSLDMATYYVNMQSNGYIANDFFTSCLSKGNGRALFGMTTSWPILLGVGWYETLYAWMMLNSALMPVAAYLCFSNITPSKSAYAKAATWCLVLFAIIMPLRVTQLAVGWWSGWITSFHPSAFAFSALFLGGCFIASANARPLKTALGSMLVFLACLLHPAHALGGAVFLALILIPQRGERKKAAAMLLAALLGALFVKMLSDSGSMDAYSYYRYFSWMHPEHYIPSRFIAMGAFHWTAPVFIINGILILSSLLLLWLGRKTEAAISLALCAFYLLSLLAQYIFVERFPISKSILLISPVRFLAFGYWMIVASAAMLAGSISSKYGVNRPEFQNSSQVAHRPRYGAMLLAGSLVVLAIVGFLNLKKPIELVSQNEREVIEWINKSTKPNDVIAAPQSNLLSVAIPILSGRGSYSGNGFPFEDRCLAENYARYTNIYGDPTGPRGRMDAEKYYAALDISHFQQITPPSDWVVMNKSSAGAEESLARANPVFENGAYLIFKARLER